MKSWLLPAGRILFSVLLFFLLAAPASRRLAPFFPIIDVRLLPSLLAAARPAYLFPAVVLMALAVLAVIRRWQVILGDYRVSFGRLARLTMVGYFFNNFLPTAAGGDILKGYYFLRGRRENKMDLGFSIVFDRMIGTLTILGMGAAAALLYFRHLPAGLVYAIILLFLGILLMARLAARYSGQSRVVRVLPRVIRFRADNFLKSAHQSFRFYLRDRRLLGRAAACSCLSQVLMILVHYLVTLSLGTPVSLRVLFLVVPLVWTVSALPSMGGLGVRETGYVFFFQGYLVREEAFALALVMLGFFFLNSIVGGFFYFLGVRKRGDASP